MNKNKMSIIIIGVILLIMVLIGTTYAYFTANITGDESSLTLTVSGGTLSIEVIDGNTVSIENIIPGPEAKATKTITLSGSNTTDLSMPYTLSLIIESNTFSNNAISFSLECTNESGLGTILSSIGNQGIMTGQSTIALGNGDYPKGVNIVHEYTLKLYLLNIDDDQNDEQGKEINGYVKLESGKAV